MVWYELINIIQSHFANLKLQYAEEDFSNLEDGAQIPKVSNLIYIDKEYPSKPDTQQPKTKNFGNLLSNFSAQKNQNIIDDR